MHTQRRWAFRDAVYTVCGLEADPHTETQSAQWIDAVDMTKASRHCYVGDFISGGKIDVVIGTPCLILVANPGGPNTRYSTTYRVVRLDENGGLTATNIEANDTMHGWAIDLRNQVAHALQRLAGRP